MTGRQRIESVLVGGAADRAAVLPIVHTGLARMQGVPLGRYFTDANAMADVIVAGCRDLGLDGVQLTMGVAGEAEALGATVEQPSDGAPLIKQHPLKDVGRLDDLRQFDPAAGGRMPMYHAAVAETVRRIGEDTFVVSTLRGPLNIASQLRGVEDMLVDMIDNPGAVERVLDFATEVAIRCAQASLESGAHGLAFGEATCSPNFISPAMYRRFVQPRHVRLIAALRPMGWRHVGLHVCGNILPIIDDLIATGADWLDVDYQVPAAKAIERAAGRVALRGNLDPVAVFLHGDPQQVMARTTELIREVADSRWILSSGCDIPPGSPRENLAAFVAAAGN
ncbi:MAG: uroporphyrinogen decarboxylase family protein [Planctomycetes bacterium]|nr:uroporphyrinogen decarboxylase family protein [Planctomycetota bacterium]